MFKKKEKKEAQPQYYTSKTGMPTYNYKVYYMSAKEKLAYSLLCFAIGAIIGYLFYGGIGKDEYGQATTLTYILNVAISGIVGFVGAKVFVPVIRDNIRDKKKSVLRKQFRDLLEGVTTSLGAGNNVTNSFQAAYEDLKLQYEPDAYIIKELEIILSGMVSNFPIEDMLYDFGERSGEKDIQNFAEVFRVCYRKGGNIRDVIAKTNSVISKKMEINEEIETMISGSKLNQNILVVMPIILIGVIKLMSPEFAQNFVTGAGLVSTTVAVICFIVSYFVGRKIMNIKL